MVVKSHAQRNAQSLIEFAAISLALYILLAATIEMGRALFGAQVLQQAANVCGRELSKAPLPPTATFADALNDPDVKKRIYDKRWLVIDLDADVGAGQSLDDFFANKPLVNQQLRSLLIYEEVGGKRLLRYPGALLVDGNQSTGYTVAIPEVTSRGTSGVETISWVEVVEEVKAAAGDGPFSLTSAGTFKGMVAVRINYPFQAATTSAFQTPNGPFEPGPVIEADDTDVTDSSGPLSGSLRTADDGEVGTYAGPYGLGRQLAWGTTVRPFRRLLSAQSIGYRREITN